MNMENSVVEVVDLNAVVRIIERSSASYENLLEKWEYVARRLGIRGADLVTLQAEMRQERNYSTIIYKVIELWGRNRRCEVKVADLCDVFEDCKLNDVAEKLAENFTSNACLDFQDLHEADNQASSTSKSGIRFDVMSPATNFSGREDELQRLNARVLRGDITVVSHITTVSGLGGIGKTQLARQYISDYKNQFDDIIWLVAEKEDVLKASFRRLCNDKLGLSTQSANGSEKDIKTVIQEVYGYFQGRKALLVFDNAENTPWFKAYLPRGIDKPPHIIITSRDCEWQRGVEILNLSVLLIGDAMQMVKKGLDIRENMFDEDIIRLCETLQCFPLALQQAISYILDQQVVGNYTISQYLEEYEKQTLEMLSFDQLEDELMNDYTKTTYTTWKMTIKAIKGNSEFGPTAIQLLEFMAFLNPDFIYRSVFLDKGIANATIKGAVRLLVRYSMISERDNQNILMMHRLVQEVIKLKLRREKRGGIVLLQMYKFDKQIVHQNVVGRTLKNGTLPKYFFETYKQSCYLLSQVDFQDKENIKDSKLIFCIRPRVQNLKAVKEKLTNIQPKYGDEIVDVKSELDLLYELEKRLNDSKDSLEFALKHFTNDSPYVPHLKLTLAITNMVLGNQDGAYNLLEELCYSNQFPEDDAETLICVLSKIQISLLKSIEGHYKMGKDAIRSAYQMNNNYLFKFRNLYVTLVMERVLAYHLLREGGSDNVKEIINVLEKHLKTESECHERGGNIYWLFLMTITYLGDAYRIEGDLDKALKFHKECSLKAQRVSHPLQFILIHHIKKSIAQDLSELGDHAGAICIFEDVLSRYRDSLMNFNLEYSQNELKLLCVKALIKSRGYRKALNILTQLKEQLGTESSDRMEEVEKFITFITKVAAAQ